MERVQKIRRPQKLKRYRKRKTVIDDGREYIIDWYSVALAFISLLTLVLGALPSVRVISSDKTVAFFDFIQYLPHAFAIFEIIALCSVMLNSIFAFIASVPRLFCTVLSGFSLVSTVVTLLSADMRLIGYSDGGFLMHGLNYTLSIPIILLLSFASLSLSVLSYLREREEGVE